MAHQHETGSASTHFRIGAVSAADIVLIYDQSPRLRKVLTRFFNVVGQRILASVRKMKHLNPTLWGREFSHVMLGVGGGLIIHADGKTVAVAILDDALHFQTEEASIFQVYRRKEMPHDLADKITKSAMRYYNQKYRFVSYFVENMKEDTTQFCSRLVAYAYSSAGLPLTSLPENKVLPIDLYQICQSQAWEDVSAKFVQEQPGMVDTFPPIEVPDHGEMPLRKFLEYADSVMRKGAQLSKETIEIRYETTRKLLENEATLALFCAHLLDLSKKIRLVPSALEDTDASRIVRVLTQLESLLALSRLPTIDLLIMNSFLNRVEDKSDVSLYAGYPPPSAIREMQRSREELTIYTYLLFAEIGLFTILAHRTPHEKFGEFRSVKSEYADAFIAALRPFHDLSSYENEMNVFEWVESESDRATCRTTFRNIIAALKIIGLLRNSGRTTD